MEPNHTVLFETDLRIDIRRTLSLLGHGGADPTLRLRAADCWRAMNTPTGPATLRVQRECPGRYRFSAWGDGAEQAVALAPRLIGVHDNLEAFDPTHKLVRDLHRRLMGLRLTGGSQIFDLLVPTIIHQRVTTGEAQDSWRGLVYAIGSNAPGPLQLRLPPTPGQLKQLPVYAFRRHGLEGSRAATLLRAAAVAMRLEEAGDMPFLKAAQRLQTVRGIGHWTAAFTLAKARGWADAVPIGDVHLPNAISWALAGEPRGDDRRMIELLQPFEGHRFRVVRLLKMGGVKAPRFGPKQERWPGA